MGTKNGEKDENSRNSTKSKPTFGSAALLLTLGALLRFIIMISKYQIIISNHIEVSTPLSSWKRVLEGIFLFSKGVNPYEGDLLHETPLAIHIYKYILENVFRNVHLMFIAYDLGTGLLLYFSALKYVKDLVDEHRNKDKFSKDMWEHLPNEDFMRRLPVYVLMAFLFNPYSILGCVGHSTVGIHNFFLSLFIFGMVYGSAIVSSAALALCASISFYPVILILPLAIYFVKIHGCYKQSALSVVCFLISLLLITMYNSNFGKDFTFVRNVYGCILTVPDLQPNIGLFWYFFTEMFDHFRDLFIYSFQINATILYLVPLSVRFRNTPFILTFALLFLITIFKSYPCLSDLGFVLSLLPNFLHLFPFCQQGFIIGVMLLMTTCLAPVLWHLWIYSASANANFYFGVTLAHAIAQIFLVTDVLFTQTKWEYLLKHGKDTKIDGENGILTLE
ncbi:phosphatidylinositol glycan anchor biosynthesis class U protein [Anthonomus grandis grandis]|uniref:phosphatidylinositol glycan anchor biosynthesis class U protein n=1 Tax=Anthonomus grandis grandis TaxID=2921223 RepID=UPI0021667FB1|nr:phosphatidylinositol glycan anchor biosynthesis class U protein [Anthonomus grandis grandis]